LNQVIIEFAKFSETLISILRFKFSNLSLEYLVKKPRPLTALKMKHDIEEEQACQFVPSKLFNLIL